jgi:hypothetical protein
MPEPPTDRLTPEQLAVVNAAPDAKLLITAGAGTGKTHVLVARLRELIATHHLRPGQEILVLSFSRAAVREIRDRVASVGGDVAYVRACTFDSFATRLLAAVEPDGAWTKESYDGRIAAATTLLSSRQDAQEYLRAYRHLMVDEIQDLVGVRAELVKAVLEHVDGLTLFGDPAQGIYNYQLKGADRLIGSRALYAWIRQRFAGKLVERRLTKNFRAQSKLAGRAFAVAAARLDEADPDYKNIRVDLDTLLKEEAPSLVDLDNAVPWFRRAGGTTAVLCRTNGQALLISGKLHEAGVPHRLQRAAVDRVVAPWVAILFNNYERRRIGRSQFYDRLRATEFGCWEPPPPEVAWMLLKRTDRRRTFDDLDLGTVSERIMVGDVPDELTASAPPGLVVSTIHRAKGLEFDRAVVLEPGAVEDNQELGEETRLLYVALTRPRSELYHLGRPKTWALGQRGFPDERWVQRGHKHWQMARFEVRGNDVHRADPAGGFLIEGRRASDLQNYLRDSVKPGDPLTLSRITDPASRIYYIIRHDGTPVGVTSEQFGGLLFTALRILWSKSQFPETIEDVFVDTIDTVAGTEAAAVRADLGPTGLWLRVRPYGLGSVRFGKSGH